ncbi:hypothetical protein Q5P01_023723 [Channa striata]|uniref:Uncharacterized protein n=1 Tax=Channa striata TaxID=64152 RepID=A0AA88IUW4_CHASR|nr:hypothetical protein Q5P01_023723 [Channa striata]
MCSLPPFPFPPPLPPFPCPSKLRHVISHHKNRGGKTRWRYRCLRVSGTKAACKYSRERRRSEETERERQKEGGKEEEGDRKLKRETERAERKWDTVHYLGLVKPWASKCACGDELLLSACAVVQISQGLSCAVGEERGLSKDWQGESMETGLTHPAASLMKRSKALRFYGLMGKRSGTKKPFQINRRNKGEMFVGLMGRSISSDASSIGIKPFATTALDVSEKPHKQGSSEEWAQILF